jgi:hypothetical protein
MKKTLIIAALAAMAFLAGNSAQASLVPGWSGSATFTGTGGPETVNYFVDVSGGVYTYVYQFNVPTFPIGEYEVNVNVANISSVLASGNTTISTLATADGQSAVFNTANTTYSSASTANPTQVQWIISPAATGSYAFAFTSPYGPINGSGSLIDGTSGPWGDNPGSGGTPIPVPNPPAPVPEASTIMAGALMLLPLGIGAVRSLRKERTA